MLVGTNPIKRIDTLKEQVVTIRGRVKNGVIRLGSLSALPNGAEVEIRLLPKAKHEPATCFAIECEQFDPAALEAMRGDLTPAQYRALRAIARSGGPDIEAIRRIRAASMS